MNPDRVAEASAAALAWDPNATVRHTWRLEGGMSAHMIGLELDTADRVRKVVARFPDPYLKTFFEDPAAQEYRVLEVVHAHGLPAPRPLWQGSGMLLLEYLEGSATAAPEDPGHYVDQMADVLAKIHAVDISSGAFDFLLPNRVGFNPPEREPNLALREPEVIAALHATVPNDPGPSVLRHGDFWPGNLLWQDGRLTGIIDWENALRGPALADLGVTRLDLWWAFGPEAAERFTNRYLSIHSIPVTDLVYWDLRAAMRPMTNLGEWAGPYQALGRPEITEAGMTSTLLAFIKDALGRIG